MSVNKDVYQQISTELNRKNVTLVAVSKTKPVSDIQELYDAGQRDFGENYVQELVEKEALLPKDIRWHFIGHLQRNKVKNITPFVHLIHGVDSFNLLVEINKQAEKNRRIVTCLLQVHIAQEETKFGFNEEELDDVFEIHSNLMNGLENVNVAGLMGMASFTDDLNTVRREFQGLNELFQKYNKLGVAGTPLTTLSMGMSADYKSAIVEGSTMVRIGSLLFGARDQQQ